MRVFMREHQMWFTEVTGLEAVIPQLDVLYMTRIQKERFVDPLEYERNKGIYVLTRRKLERARPDMLVMHPRASGGRDHSGRGRRPPRRLFQQARYGMFARMALLEHLALQPRDEHPAPVEIGTRPICRNPRCITQTEHYLPLWSKGLAAWTAAASVTRPWAEDSAGGAGRPAGEIFAPGEKIKKRIDKPLHSML